MIKIHQFHMNTELNEILIDHAIFIIKQMFSFAEKK